MAEVCTCGKPRVELPNGRTVCTNPKHPATSTPLAKLAPAVVDEPAAPAAPAKPARKRKAQEPAELHPSLVAVMQPRGKAYKAPKVVEPEPEPTYTIVGIDLAAEPEPDPVETAVAQALIEDPDLVVIPVPAAGTPEAAALQTREGWMLRAVDVMRPWFPDGHTVPQVRISFGWPGGRGSKAGVRGQCWYTTDDSLPAIFISPDQTDEATVLGIILHELVHASGQSNHTPSGFGKVAGPLGFMPKWTSSENKTEELTAKLAELAAQLGPMDHARVNNAQGLYGTSAARPPVQSTRMLKLTCQEQHDNGDLDGYLVRTTSKWIAAGLPLCPEGHDMVLTEADGTTGRLPR
jgi:hypothetical protein